MSTAPPIYTPPARRWHLAQADILLSVPCPGHPPTRKLAQCDTLSPPTAVTTRHAVVHRRAVNKNYTIHMHEWHDVVNDRGRTDLYHQPGRFGRGGMDSSVYDYKNNRYYHSTSTSNKWGDMKHLEGRNFMSGNGAHITSSEKFFRFGGNQTETYGGQQYVRGILCDKWTATMCSTRSGCSGGNYTLDYFFSAANWHIPEANSTRVPVRCELKGWRLNTRTPGKVVNGHYVRGAKLNASDYTKHTQRPRTKP